MKFYIKSEEKEPIYLYHVSRNHELRNLILEPRIPPSVSEGEDVVIRRVCVARNIEDAIRGTDPHGDCRLFYVYRSKNKISDYYIPTAKQVPDVNESHEIWYLKNLEVEFVKIIER